MRSVDSRRADPLVLRVDSHGAGAAAGTVALIAHNKAADDLLNMLAVLVVLACLGCLEGPQENQVNQAAKAAGEAYPVGGQHPGEAMIEAKVRQLASTTRRLQRGAATAVSLP